jgi:hypothetical protein
VWVAVDVTVGVRVRVCVNVDVDELVAVRVAVRVLVGVTVRVRVGVRVRVRVGVRVRVAVGGSVLPTGKVGGAVGTSSGSMHTPLKQMKKPGHSPSVSHDKAVGSPTHCPCSLQWSLNVRMLKSSHGAPATTVFKQRFWLSLQASAVH